MSTSSSQVSRLLALVPYVQQQGGIPIDELAAQFGVDRVRIIKDLRLLPMTGPGHRWGGQLIDIDYGALDDGIAYVREAEFMARPLRLNGAEAASIVVALRALRASAQPAQIPVIDSALAKLESAALSASAAPVDVRVEPVDQTIHANIAQAVDEGIRLHLTYTGGSRDDVTERDVDPLRIFTAQGRLYLQAWCLSSQDLRFFRLDRMTAATLTGVPADTHPVEPRQFGAQFFGGGADAVSAVIDVAPAGQWVIEEFGTDIVAREGDTARVRINGSDRQWLIRLALRHADMISVVEPGDLRDEVAAAARLALAAYAEDSPF